MDILITTWVANIRYLVHYHILGRGLTNATGRLFAFTGMQKTAQSRSGQI